MTARRHTGVESGSSFTRTPFARNCSTVEIVFDPFILTRLMPRQPESERIFIKPTGSRHIGHGIHGKRDMLDHDETPDC